MQPDITKALPEQRQRLPNRRASETFAVECAGLSYVATISRFNDERIAELFLTNHRADSSAGIMSSDCAIAASLAFQYGCPVDVLSRALSRDGRGRPTSPLGVALAVVAASDERTS